MNDFLDRVTAKAIGNEAMLTPRLPSLFEPQAASIMPVTFETNAIVEQRNSQGALYIPDVAHRDLDMQPKPSPLELQPDRTSPKQAQSQPDTAQRPASRVETQPAIETTRHSSDVAVEKMAQSTTTERTGRDAKPRQPVEPRTSHVSSSEPQTPPPVAHAAESGVLLPPVKPVFVSTKNLGDLPARAAEAMHSRSIGVAGHPAGQSEPVVHVSIGRLEVRAAPNSAPTSARRNDAPRPSSLDDYLRQRGKATP